MPTTRSADHTRALAMLLIANFFWGLSFPLIKSILLVHEKVIPEAGPWFSTVMTLAPRFLLATLILSAWRPLSAWQASAAEWRQGVGIGLFSAAGMLFQNDGLQYTAASTSAFLTQFYAILIPIWTALRLRRSPGAIVWICCALVLAGVAILGRFNWRELHLGRGEVETLVSSVFFMGQILLLERPEFAGNRAAKVTLIMFATEAAIFGTVALIMAPNVESLLAPWRSGPWLVFMIVLTVLCTCGSFGLMNAWQPKITAIEAGLIYCVEPIFGSVMALFLPALFSVFAGIAYANESATWTLLVGGGLITLANVLLQAKPPPKADR